MDSTYSELDLLIEDVIIEDPEHLEALLKIDDILTDVANKELLRCECLYVGWEAGMTELAEAALELRN